MSGNVPDHAGFAAAAVALLPDDRVISDPLQRRVFGVDASFYRLVPKLVVLVEDEGEVAELCRAAQRHGTPLTFRAAGTSLSGQAVTDSVLVRLGHDGWRGWRVGEAGAEVTLGPGLTGSQANARLAPYGRKIGPDPASINAAMIGGIAANNASGMCCGVAQNSYHTVKSMCVVLADGTRLDTGDEVSRAALREGHPQLIEGLEALAARTKADPELAGRIRDKFKIKNTTGYSLNALIDFDDPFEILQHLMIGSEGTLGFISEITYRTVEDPPHKASALVVFPDVEAACRAVAALSQTPVAAVEIMDGAALRSVAHKPGFPDRLKGLPGQAAALLIETRAGDKGQLWDQVETVSQAIAGEQVRGPVTFSDQASDYAPLWAIRKGLFPSVGAMRQTGTTVVIEDVAVAVERLAAAMRDLQGLFSKHGYDEAIIFGHALEGNVHFVFTQAFDSPAEVARYGAFMDDVTRLIAGAYDGSLKAEHSTGRNMAPFVELEWGRAATRLMAEIKALFDPQGLLNPGVILNDDPEVHLKNLKPMPAVDPALDKCIECGFCEPSCPSRALSFTPRQRIAALREFVRGTNDPDEPAVTAEALNALFTYPGVETCAGDGLCSLACPVEIDTGKAIKGIRGRRMSGPARWLIATVARHYGLVLAVSRLGLGATALVQRMLGPRLFFGLYGKARRLLGGRVPFLPDSLPRPAKALPHTAASGTRPRLVYFPSCAARLMGPGVDDEERASLPEILIKVFDRAGYDLVLPERPGGLCCGMPFESKGHFQVADRKSAELRRALEAASENGRLPIIFDTSPCALRLLRAGAGNLQILEPSEALARFALPQLALNKTPGPIALHATCSTRRMNLEPSLRAVAEACCDEVIEHADIQCCGFAGDKGFTRPELNANALRHLREDLPADCRAGVSTSRTCEIGLSHHSGRPYRSIAYLVERCSR